MKTRRSLHRIAANPARSRAALRLTSPGISVPEILDIAAYAHDNMGSVEHISARDYYTGPLHDIIMAPFLFPNPSRFSNGRFGVLYSAFDLATATAEHGYHLARFARNMHLTQHIFHRLHITLETAANLRDLHDEDKRIFDPNDYTESQRLGVELHRARTRGILYPSVRRHPGLCAGFFFPRAIKNPQQLSSIAYSWKGNSLEAYEKPINLN